ncbi:MAG: DNA repair protein RecN [Tannerellaceae bacterium]|jgi:DNA repair protein RecN (Recombination protein N)|nr:DNA repair protein RecN [Tannerellaceae bacterium]
MLKSLFIQNFVLIDLLDIRFNDSFTVITGETGAGKSIILGALALALGQRADTRSVKSGEERCVIEAAFNVSKFELEEFFAENELEYDPDTCILRRELFASGKSRAYVNDSPASLNALKELGNRLIDIHSQHQNLLLADTKFQLKVVDVMAQNEPSLKAYRKLYGQWTGLKKELADLIARSNQAKQDEEYVRYQLEQLEEAKLSIDEPNELEEELAILANAEDIKSAMYRIGQQLNGDETGALIFIKDALNAAESLRRFMPEANEMVERLNSAFIDLKDLASDASYRAEDIEFDPERLEWINKRLDTLYTLQQKHRLPNVGALIELRDSYRAKLTDIESFEDQIEEIRKKAEAAALEVRQAAEELHLRRASAAERVAIELVANVSQLGMPNTRFRVELPAKQEPDEDGIDDVRFMFSAHKTGELERVAQTASGGEISRLMLCVKAMIAGSTALPAIIFDEVDTGVSGDIADKMGVIMQQLGQTMQVVAITHLPQIASKGNEHYFVYKEDSPQQTLTQVRLLEGEERVMEIARMLSGASLTEASIANARDLLKPAKL